MLFGAISSIFLLGLGFSPADVAFSKTVQSLVVLLCDVPLSILGERIGHKWVLVGTAFLDAMYFLLLPSIHTPLQLYVLEVLNALSLAGISGSLETILVRSSSNSEGKHSLFGRLHQWVYLSSAVVGFIGGILVKFPNWVCYTSGLGLFGLTALSVFLLPSPHLNAAFKPRERLAFWKLPVVFFRSGINIRKILPLAIAMSLLSTFIQFWQLLVNPFISEEYRPIYGPLFFGILLAQSLAGRMSKKGKRHPSSEFLKILILLLGFTSLFFLDMWFVVLLLLPVFFFVKSLNLILLGDFHDHIAENLRSEGHSIQMVLSRCLNFLTFALMGWGMTTGLGPMTIPLCSILLVLLAWIVSVGKTQSSFPQCARHGAS